MSRKPSKSSGSSFQTCLSIGKEFENYCKKEFETHGWEIREAENKNHDFIMSKDGKEYYVECKCDRRAATSGNIGFETEYRGTPSGIKKEGWDLWVQGKPDGNGNYDLVIVPRKVLETSFQQWIDDGVATFKPWFGDGAKGYIVPWSTTESIKVAAGDV